MRQPEWPTDEHGRHGVVGRSSFFVLRRSMRCCSTTCAYTITTPAARKRERRAGGVPPSPTEFIDLEPEFDVLGVPFAERGVRLDEAIRAMKELWTSDNPRFNGRWVQFDDLVFDPRPVQQPHPPIWIGGWGKNALRRAAELGDGLYP